MDLFKYLEDDDNREKLSIFIHNNMPELLECDPNNHIHNTICILKRETMNKLQFSLVLINKEELNQDRISYQNLHDIRIDNSDLHDIEKSSIMSEWGYKLGEGLKYPNLGLKFKSLINKYFRKQKLLKIQRGYDEDRLL